MDAAAPAEPLRLAIAAVLCAMSAGAWAQATADMAGVSNLLLVPRFTVTQTFTDNVFLSAGARQAEAITELSPGIRVSSRGGRVSGSLDYALNELLYANHSAGRTAQNALNAMATVEAIEGRAFVDVSAVVAQQAISAFGAPVVDAALLGANRTETALYRIAPSLRGRLGAETQYEARLGFGSSRSKSALVSDIETQEASARIGAVEGRLGAAWFLQASAQRADYRAGRTTLMQRADAQLGYPLGESVAAYVKAGFEKNDFGDANGQHEQFGALGATWAPSDEARLSVDTDASGRTGIVAAWSPSKRTNLSFTREHRLYGDSHTLALVYRSANTAWTFSDTRAALSTTGRSGFNDTASVYDLLLAQFSATESDPIKRERYAQFLLANGIRPSPSAVLGFQSAALALQRQQQLSFALLGVRSTLSVVATRSANSRLDSLSAATDDLSAGGSLRQDGLSLSFSQRLSVDSSFNAVVARQIASRSADGRKNASASFNATVTMQVRNDIAATLGARRVTTNGSASPFTESALFANLTLRF